MIEMTFDQPLASLAVEGVVKVLVVPEPPKCEKCHGRGWWLDDSPIATADMRVTCWRCVGSGLARWPAGVTIRSSTEEPWVNYEGRGDRYGPFRTRRNVGAFYLTDMRDGNRIPLPLGEVVGTVTVEAAVPILDPRKAKGGTFVYSHEGGHLSISYPLSIRVPPDVDIADQLAFQEFPVGHTALILEGETDG